jgi:hypothetical protein
MQMKRSYPKRVWPPILEALAAAELTVRGAAELLLGQPNVKELTGGVAELVLR